MKHALLILTIAGLAACGKSEATKRSEVERCSAMNTAADLIALCLETQFRWKADEAAPAAQARQRELDSLRAWQEDSVWNLEAAKHRAEIRTCQRQLGELSECLLTYGWTEQRAVRTADSIWRAEGSAHRREIQACRGRERTGNIAGCLELYYKWPSKRALAANDSIRRAELR